MAAVLHRADTAIDDWGSNFVRLCMESYRDRPDWGVQWQGILDDAEYLEDIVEIVEAITAKPDVYLLLSLWQDPTFTELGWPTSATIPIWEVLATRFAHNPRVIFGLSNEPQMNYDGAHDAEVWEMMNTLVQAIRDVEASQGAPEHLITVQGTRGWARWLTYYVDHPITASGGSNVVYETHIYDAESDFDALIDTPHQTLPVIIGEFAPDGTYMQVADSLALMPYARARDIPHLAWTFHHFCRPNLLANGAGCAIEELVPTEWGQMVIEGLATPW